GAELTMTVAPGGDAKNKTGDETVIDVQGPVEKSPKAAPLVVPQPNSSSPPTLVLPAKKPQGPNESIFNGKDFTDWTAGAEWSVENGTIVGRSSGKNSSERNLFTTRTYKDFEISYEIKLPEGSSKMPCTFIVRAARNSPIEYVGARLGFAAIGDV